MLGERITAQLEEIPSRLVQAKEKGVKIIGYFPGGYVPEELIIASGAIPVCLMDVTDNTAVEAALTEFPHFFCPFSLAQVGERLLKRNQYYNLIDMFIAPITCQHLKKVAELWEYQSDIEMFKLGVPHHYNNEFEVEYFADRLRALIEKLQAVTGNTITDNKINDAIAQYNKIRGLFRQISLLRRDRFVPISSLDFVRLNHKSFYADPALTIEMLEKTLQDINKRSPEKGSNAPRLLIAGPNICNGDYKLLELVEDMGGNIVIEEIFEGIRDYWGDISIGNDPVKSLVDGYLVNRVPPAFMRDTAKKRLDNILKLISEFKVSGVIWYELMYCETYDSESFYFAEKLKEHNIPLLILESDYSKADIGQLRTRLQAYLEMLS